MIVRTGSRALAAALLLAAPGAAATFQPLGDLVGDDFHSFAYALSGDGTTVVGESHSGNGHEAFRWNGSMTGLGDLPLGIFESRVSGASGDGSVVVGFGNTLTGQTGFTWNTSTATLTPLAALSSGPSQAYAVSSNGLVAVGSSDSLAGVQAVSWTGGAAPVPLGDLTGGAFRSQALAVSADGTTIAGDSDSANGVEAFVWRVGALSGLGDLAGGDFDSQAFGVSPDGTRVVGRGESASGDEAFVWQSGTGLQGLGDLPGGIFSSAAFDVTNAGVVVGTASGASGPQAVLWQAGTPYPVLSVLVANGLHAEVAGWKLTEARAISDDGLTLAGFGVNPSGNTEGWRAAITFVPEPSTPCLLVAGIAFVALLRSLGRFAPRAQRCDP